MSFFSVLTAQHKIIDSLVLVSQSATSADTIKINANNELAWEFRKTNFTLAKKYALEAYVLSQKCNYLPGLITSLNRLGTVYIFNKQYSQAENIYLKVLKLETKIGNKYGIGRASNQLSEIYRNKKNFKKAISYATRALIIFKELNKSSLVALILNNLGLIYQNIGSYEIATKYLLQSLDIREKLGEENNCGYSYMNLGVLYLTMKNYENAKTYLFKSEKIFIKYRDDYELSKIYNNLGVIFFETGNDNLAKGYYEKSLGLKKKIGIKNTDSDIYNNLGAFYYRKGIIETANNNFQKSLSIQNNYISKDQLKDATINLGNLFFQKQDYDGAIKYYQKALKTSKNSPNRIETLNALYNLYLSYSYKKQYDSAMYYHKDYNSLRNNIDADYKKAIDLKQKYEQKKKENELLIKNQKISKINIEKLSLENQNKNILIYTLSTIFALAALLFFIFLRWKGEKQKAELALKDKKLEEKKLEELIKNQELKSINDMIKVQDEERKRISQDLHDRLGSMLSVAKVYYKSGEEQMKKNKKFDFEQFQKANILLDEACQEVRKISYEMSSGVLTKFGLIAAVEELLIVIQQTKKMKVEFIASDIENRLDSNVEIQVYRIIQELLNNILKYSEAKNVTVQILKLSSILNVQVEDDGEGFDKTKRSKGLGLNNINSRVQSLAGSIDIDSALGRGTSVNIEIPINSYI
ncbi:Signal transduction histidine kinase [Chryseobacterium wanjuense]|uniref:Oxygen sensor histidine kinase NreB n=1 Tax=Chryseobacterium wanjuense TaxID=356305 RepID=A0A1I0QK25_9FLAO|nr:tetratricopeptide repeat protein [Chryseobacterium wanjuense]SEW27567.1 Signal transduction histidine kinase [Chryseobacterium wanjuense]